jgi:hypothetical protein
MVVYLLVFFSRCSASHFRSRSITPSSFSGTPPQTMHSHDVLNASAPNTILPPMPNSNRPEFQARNYSDFMRSLAAKYNNGNNNE